MSYLESIATTQIKTSQQSSIFQREKNEDSLNPLQPNHKMVRCTSTTKSGRRCKLPALVNDTVCSVHVYDDMPPLVEIPQETLEAANTLVNMAVIQTCNHDLCLLHINECCACSDTRSEDAQYVRYVDGVGDAPIGKREDEYCSNCRNAFAPENRILDRYRRFLAIEQTDYNRSGLVFAGYLLRDELNNLINQCTEIRNSLDELLGNSMNLT